MAASVLKHLLANKSTFDSLGSQKLSHSKSTQNYNRVVLFQFAIAFEKATRLYL